MKHFFLALLFMFSGIYSIIGQTITDKLGIGFNVGGAKIYGDHLHTGFGLGLESYLKYNVNQRFFVLISAGYAELSDGTFHLDKSTFTNNTFNFDVKGAINLVPNKTTRPYAFLGLGVINFHSGWLPYKTIGYFDATLILGGGLEYQINPTIGLNVYSDYRFTTGDDLDDISYGAKDGYLNIRGGITYYFSPQRGVAPPKVLAEKAPLEEIEGTSSETKGTSSEDKELQALIEGLDNYEEASESEFNMKEYIKLKSRVDQLNDAIRQKELEIEELKAQLESRKEKVTALEQRMRNKGGALAASLNMNLGDFSTSYEQGLEQFYAHEYDAAIYIFNLLLEAYPYHRLASNCQYWIGECYFGQGNFQSALESFKMIFNYERSVKKDDALIMMGRCYIKLGDGQMAREMFDRLMNEYPDSEYFYKAKKYATEF